MKTLKLLSGFALVALLFTSCYTEVIIEDQPTTSLHSVLNSYELWYVDVNETIGFGETPFLQIAFTVSFKNGTLYANNNLVGIGSQGNGFGIPVGTYGTYDMVLDVDHDIDGFNAFDVYVINSNTIELYNSNNDTSYFLHGYQRNTFDYDFVFYDNIHYFLQEYQAWEKTYTSDIGALNEFDYENYLQFLSGGDDSDFRSSQDEYINNTNDIYWDYSGKYGVQDVTNNNYLKTLTLDYDYFDNEYFELNVINDARIELYHPTSGTYYEFEGRGYIEYMRTTSTKTSKSQKKRKQKTEKKDNPRVSTRH